MKNTDEDSNGVPNPIWDKLSEKDKGYLLTACLPHKINRHTLEFFCDARTAAYCYNWLSRRPEYATRDILDYFILNEAYDRVLGLHYRMIMRRLLIRM